MKLGENQLNAGMPSSGVGRLACLVRYQSQRQTKTRSIHQYDLRDQAFIYRVIDDLLGQMVGQVVSVYAGR